MNCIFLDSEELSQALKHTDVSAMQVSRGKFRATLSVVPVRDWSLQYLCFEEGDSVCAGNAPRHNFAFVVPLDPAPQCRLLGQPVSLQTFGVYAPGSEHADTTVARSEKVVIVAPANFADQADREGVALSRHGSHLRRGSSAAMLNLQNLLREIPQALSGAESQRSISDELLCTLTTALSSTQSTDADESTLGRPKLPRQAILKRMWEILESRQDESIYAGELAAQLGISQPSLQRAFHEWFGMPPARYLALRRLYLARRRLRDANGETVTNVASSLGFWHLSRFTKSYKAVFGALPSETLRTSKRF